MLTKEDIERLATLARIDVSEEEKKGLAKDLDAVLAYVSEVSKITTESDTVPRVGELRNVMREDADAYPGGEWSEAILANAPHKEDGYFKVGQIF
ncbi:MAG: Asp-tRNA(Asn)/Glu-tRNA(Gln) amidotransferase subunit GatC [Patescibacteria group bacterium]